MKLSQSTSKTENCVTVDAVADKVQRSESGGGEREDLAGIGRSRERMRIITVCTSVLSMRFR